MSNDVKMSVTPKLLNWSQGVKIGMAVLDQIKHSLFSRF